MAGLTPEPAESVAPSTPVTNLGEVVILQILDPKVTEQQMAQDLGQPTVAGQGNWQCACDVLEAAGGADALLLLTE